ncbi:two-component system sensor histidine kinase BaeS [Allocatelliglobosispora scoriae]|uniref:histidine kinase n=1 Tax=Allocatelliglobosispora scoriae TaxID=643052 RepID=A0A841BVF0_9ACTN|nr:HAMP domain-containing sensor histidine kinase [Allocatelliglobosispora scoriae]MBB5871139.1 two-component system sensor histidine kinase BaeS [Allocatelliglobosispora scoriae]
MPPAERRRGMGLTARAVLAGGLVALISVLVTAAVAVPLAVRASEARARDTLAVEANLVAELLKNRVDVGRVNDEQRIAKQLRNEGTGIYIIRNGVADRAGLPAHVIQRVTGGSEVSQRAALVNGKLVLVEGRPLGTEDGIVLTADATTGAAKAVWRNLWLPLLAGLAAGVLLGALLARRIAKPLRTAAAAAVRLRSGDRGVRLPVTSPPEVADIAEALNQLSSALATSESRQREFLLSISHELKTPLTTLRGYAEALGDGVVQGTETVEIGNVMLGEADHLGRLIDDLLALARLDAVDFPLTFSTVDLTVLAENVAGAWRPRGTAHGVPIRVESPDGPLVLRTDAGRVRQLVDGLLENALRVTPPGAPIVVAVFARDGAMIVEVRDGGPGFTDDDLAVAFERGALHQRYRGVRKVGSGLGLALAAGLARRLGGSITAGHAPEGGARFTVTLPS